ncbi:MAG: hypothetical protein SFV22_04995 [Saprospiraceae bacterium]|nr:hypothetical protein [Saprospiraceae bacterium]
MEIFRIIKSTWHGRIALSIATTVGALWILAEIIVMFRELPDGLQSLKVWLGTYIQPYGNVIANSLILLFVATTLIAVLEVLARLNKAWKEIDERLDTTYLNLISSHCSMMAYWEATDIENEYIEYIVSDEKTNCIQIGDTPLKKPIPCKKFKHMYRDDFVQHEDSIYRPFLRQSEWIAHTDYSNPSERIKETSYHLQREFEIKTDVSHILSAALFIMVDEDCEIVVNSGFARRVNGYKRLHFIDMRDFLARGNNVIEFKIDNISSETFTPHKQNVYGVRYLLRIAYKSTKSATHAQKINQ